MHQGHLSPAHRLAPGTSMGEERRAEKETRAQLYLLWDLGALMDLRTGPAPMERWGADETSLQHSTEHPPSRRAGTELL